MYSLYKYTSSACAISFCTYKMQIDSIRKIQHKYKTTCTCMYIAIAFYSEVRLGHNDTMDILSYLKRSQCPVLHFLVDLSTRHLLHEVIEISHKQSYKNIIKTK